MSNILDDTKKYLGLDKDYDVFDLDVKMAINGALMTLHELGVGPDEGFAVVTGGETWSQLIGGYGPVTLEAVKTYVYLKSRLVFDPPQLSFVISAIEKQILELEWRLNVLVDPGTPYRRVDDVVVTPNPEPKLGLPQALPLILGTSDVVVPPIPEMKLELPQEIPLVLG